MRTVFSRYNAAASGEWAGEQLVFKRLVGPEKHGFSTKDVYLYGGKKGGEFKPQITSGIELGKLAEMMKTLGGPGNETPEEVQARQPIRTLAYGAQGTPANLESSATTKLVGRAPGLAATIVQRLLDRGVITNDEPGRRSLEGFVSLALVYVVVLSVTSQEGIKTQIPFLSRYSFATLFNQIPDPTHQQLLVNPWVDEVAPALDAGLRLFLDTKYPSHPSVANDACGEGLDGPMVKARLKETVEGQQQRATTLETALSSFTRRQWLTAVMAGRDLLKPQRPRRSARRQRERGRSVDRTRLRQEHRHLPAGTRQHDQRSGSPGRSAGQPRPAGEPKHHQRSDDLRPSRGSRPRVLRVAGQVEGRPLRLRRRVLLTPSGVDGPRPEVTPA